MSSHEKQPKPATKEKASEGNKMAEKPTTTMGHERMEAKQGKVTEAKAEETKDKELETLRKSLEDEKQKSEQYLTSLKYLKAELENYQKRTAKEMDQLVKRGSERLARKLLAVVDDLERTINASKTLGESSKLLTGLEMILKELHKILKSEGVVKIEAVGKRFDPDLHDAVTVTRTDKSPVDTVVEELRPGYMFEDRVLRPSMVVVSSSSEKHKTNISNGGDSGEEEKQNQSDANKEVNKQR